MIAEDLWIAAGLPDAGAVSPELVAFQEAELKVNTKNLDCIKVARKMFVLYENLLRKNARHKWTTIVDSQVEADTWTDLRGNVYIIARSPLYESFEDCVTFHLLTVFPLTQKNRKGATSMCILKSLFVC